MVIPIVLEFTLQKYDPNTLPGRHTILIFFNVDQLFCSSIMHTRMPLAHASDIIPRRHARAYACAV